MTNTTRRSRRIGKKVNPNRRMRILMQGLLALKRDHGTNNLPKPGKFPKSMEESYAQGYADAIRDAFLAIRMAQFDVEYLPDINEVKLPEGNLTARKDPAVRRRARTDSVGQRGDEGKAG